MATIPTNITVIIARFEVYVETEVLCSDLALHCWSCLSRFVDDRERIQHSDVTARKRATDVEIQTDAAICNIHISNNH